MMRREGHVFWTDEYKPYDATSKNREKLEAAMDGAAIKFNGLIYGLKYDENRLPTAFDSFAEARDCITLLEQMCEALEGPYRNVTTDEKISLYRGKLEKMRKKFHPIQYSPDTLRMLFPENYAAPSEIMSQGSTKPLGKKAS